MEVLARVGRRVGLGLHPDLANVLRPEAED